MSSAQVSETRSPLSPRRQIDAWSRAGLDSAMRRTSANSVRVSPWVLDALDAWPAHVEHRVPVQHAVDHRVAIEPRQGIQLAGDGGELASGRLELSGEDLDV